ncbi:MAG: TrmH family RNA methyltransferase [Planctomycetota bacterium]
MTGSKGRKSGRAFAANHQRSWLWGRHAVHETLTAGRWPVLELLIDEELDPSILMEFSRLAEKVGLTLQTVSVQRLVDLCHAEDHQGVLARLGEFPCGQLDELFAKAETSVEEASSNTRESRGQLCNLQPLFVICDRIQDAHNFGAILRCCEAMNVSGVIVGERCQAALSPHVIRSSAGAVNYVPMFRVPDLLRAVDGLAARGFAVCAATEKTKTPVWQEDLSRASVLMIGSEAFGLAQELMGRATICLTVPMPGHISSLNAAVSAGIILYEFRRQQMTTQSR